MGIVVIGAAFVDIKGFPQDNYIPNGRNSSGRRTWASWMIRRWARPWCRSSKITRSTATM